MSEFLNNAFNTALQHVSKVDAALLSLVGFMFLLVILPLFFKEISDKKIDLIKNGIKNVKIIIFITLFLRFCLGASQFYLSALNCSGV
jgi:hypothetical protein